MVTATPATSVRDVADLPLADTPLVPIRGGGRAGAAPPPPPPPAAARPY